MFTRSLGSGVRKKGVRNHVRIDDVGSILKFRIREEHSMDQYRSRLKLSENFERHWSIPFPGEIRMDQWS